MIKMFPPPQKKIAKNSKNYYYQYTYINRILNTFASQV